MLNGVSWFVVLPLVRHMKR